MKRLFAVTPAVGLAIGAVVIGAGALWGSGNLPAQARSLAEIPRSADRVAPGPDSLSSVTVTHDWQEVGTSSTVRPPRR